MEVTGLNELKKLMKGDARHKFEFEEDNEVGSYDKSMLFSYNQKKGMGLGGSQLKSGITYSNTYAGQSHMQSRGPMRSIDKDISSSDEVDSEIAEQEQREREAMDDYKGGEIEDDFYYDDAYNQQKPTQPQAKPGITEIAEEDEDDDESSSSDEDTDQQSKTNGNYPTDGGASQEMGSSPSPNPKKEKLKEEEAKVEEKTAAEEQKRDKILTFRDMSHLSYFGGGAFLKQKPQIQQEQTPQQIAEEVIEDLLTLVSDQVDQTSESRDRGDSIVDDFTLERNFANLRKKVFVKERIDSIVQPKVLKPIVPKKSNGFKNAKVWKSTSSIGNQQSTNGTSQEKKPEVEEQKEKPVSRLTQFLDQNMDQEGDFLLPTPSDGDPHHVKIQIFLFSTPRSLVLNISRLSKVGDVIRHIMTIYRKDPFLMKELPLKYPLCTDAYELRLIDDDAEYFKPFYEVGALDKRERIGEYESLAFVQVKNFQPKDDQLDVVDLKLQEELRKQNKRILTVQVNTTLLKTKFQLTMNDNDSARQILVQVANKLKDNIYLNTKQYCLVPIFTKNSSNKQSNRFTLANYGGKNTDQMELMFNNQQSSGQFDYDASYIDLNTFIKNLKVSTVEVTERVYVDKPLKKLKEVPIERKQDVTNTLIESNILQRAPSESKDIYQGVKASFIIGQENRQTTQLDQVTRGSVIGNIRDSAKSVQPNKSRVTQLIEFEESSATPQLNEVQNTGHRQEEDFLFGSISAAKYQEFNVIKINKRGKRQNRVLGIDGFNIYNIRKHKAKDDSSLAFNGQPGQEFEKKKGSFITQFLTKKLLGDKRKARPINTIIDIKKRTDNPRAIEIVFIDKNVTKGIVYECFTQDNQSEIIAKINFLRKNQEKPLSLQKRTNQIAPGSMMPNSNLMMMTQGSYVNSGSALSGALNANQNPNSSNMMSKSFY